MAETGLRLPSPTAAYRRPAGHRPGYLDCGRHATGRATSRPVLERFGASDDDACAVGLTCGGVIDIFVEPVIRQSFPELGVVLADVEAGRPVALDIGGRTPQETAISIAAEIVAVRRGGTGGQLRALAGPIHHGHS